MSTSTSATAGADTISLRVKIFNDTGETLYCVGHRANHKIDDGSTAVILEPGAESNYRLKSDHNDIHDSITYGNKPEYPTARIELTGYVPFQPGDNKYNAAPVPSGPSAYYGAIQGGDAYDPFHPVVEWHIKIA